MTLTCSLQAISLCNRQTAMLFIQLNYLKDQSTIS